MQKERPVSLILDNGTVFYGKSFGFEQPTNGEVVFSTAMVGYPESLTDPSYSGQILVVTFPLVGNYGVPAHKNEPNGLSSFFESKKIHTQALIISDYSHEYSHWNAVESLSDWLKREKVVGIYGVDTRELTKILREKGSMKGKIVFDKEDEIDFADPNLINQVAVVSCKEVVKYGNGSKKIVLVDCGVKENIIRCLLKRDVEITRVPWDYDFNQLEYDGLFISNGPGDPNLCDATVANIRKAMETGKPIFRYLHGQPAISSSCRRHRLQTEIRSPFAQPACTHGGHK
jgi:Carbamoylphosphate synthase small subunit